jgi:hypothetical protein
MTAAPGLPRFSVHLLLRPLWWWPRFDLTRHESGAVHKTEHLSAVYGSILPLPQDCFGALEQKRRSRIRLERVFMTRWLSWRVSLPVVCPWWHPQSLTVRSSEPVARVFPSGLHAML